MTQNKQPTQQSANTNEAEGVNALDFTGNDLGQMVNNAFEQGNQAVYVPNRAGLEIKTTIKLRHASTLQYSNRYPEHIYCKTKGKPVHEVMGGIRHWRIRDGIFSGDARDTPSCFLLCGRADNVDGGGQCGDTTALSGVQTSENWGHSVITNIAGEILTFENCHLWMTGQGDFQWNKPRATVMIANQDYWGLPSAYYPPNKKSGSCSANVFQNCDIRCGMGNNSVFLLKGQVEDVTIIPTYLNSQGRAHIVIEPGETTPGNWVSPRVIRLEPGGRTECNGGPVNPLFLIDGLGRQNSGVYHLHIGPIGIFTSDPVIKCVNGGIAYWLSFREGSHLEHIGTLLEHKTGTLSWADIVSRHDVRVDCGNQAIEDSDIHVKGEVISGATYRSLIRAKNVMDFNPQAMEAGGPENDAGEANDKASTVPSPEVRAQ